MSATSKLNSIERKISEVLINNEISHENLITIISEERNYQELKESIRVMWYRSDQRMSKKWYRKNWSGWRR